MIRNTSSKDSNDMVEYLLPPCIDLLKDKASGLQLLVAKEEPKPFFLYLLLIFVWMANGI